jgi:hypothetical protein
MTKVSRAHPWAQKFAGSRTAKWLNAYSQTVLLIAIIAFLILAFLNAGPH